jgi:hypothetical protein
MTLPSEPGLLRRLAYGRSVYYRNRRRNLFVIGNNINQIIYTRRNALIPEYDELLNENFEDESQNYGKVQLSLCKLLENSIVCLGNSDTDTSCIICLDNYEKKTITRKLICNHKFHITCIETWLSNATTCPICRFDLNV